MRLNRGRGSANNPLFQINHWIERVNPSPGLAAKVNAFEFMIRRARRCRDERSLFPTILAVDFYDEGDLLGVVDVLNGSTLRPRGAGERRSAPMTLPAPPDPSAAAVSGYVVTAAGERRKLQAGGSVLKGDQCVILSPTEPLRGEVVTALQLAATRPVTIDSVSWFVIVH